MAAVLACGPSAFLTHLSAGALHGICEERPGSFEVGVRRTYLVGSPKLRVRRRLSLPSQDVGARNRIPVTSPVRTMIDLASVLGPGKLLRAINGQPGVKVLRALLDKDTFVLSDEELERLFLPLARKVGLPFPQTKIWLNGYEVDFFWPDLRLVVETDGLRYHRTPSAQARDLKRDHVRKILGETASRLALPNS